MIENQSAVLFLVAIVGLAVIGAWVLRPKDAAMRNPVEIARIVERVSFTAGGMIAVALLFLHNGVMLMMLVGATKSAVQEASIGTVWIAGNVMCGVGAIIGRRRFYVVFRNQTSANQSEANS